MKRTNKKGFTIVELVVVIAVIAILAAIMIPVFSGVTKDAQAAADQANAKAEYTQFMSVKENQDKDVDYVKVGDNYYDVANGFAKAAAPTSCTCYLDADTDDIAYVGTCVDANTDGKCDVCEKATTPANPGT